MVTLTRAGAAIAGNQVVLWAAFVLVHLWLGTLNLSGPGLPMGDVTYTYKFWTDQALFSDYWVGIDSVWVYPIVAIVPMLASMAFGSELYGNTWLSIVFILDAVAFAMLTGWGFSRERVAVAWWWVAFLLLLGPISLGRIDSITVPLAIIGVLLLAKRPGAAAVILAIATWIKVWPAAILAAVVVATRDRLTVIWAAVAVSAGVIIVALSYGAGVNVFSFFTQQTGRGLQVEAPIATVWLWLAKAGLADAHVVYSQQILTYQIEGDGVDVASQLMTPIMAVAALVVLGLGVLAVRRGASATQVLPPLALALVAALLAFNKVGSPQFVSWLAVPVILGLVTAVSGRGVHFQIPAVLVLAIGGLTQAFYPVYYANLLGLDTVLLIVITLRNLLYFVLLAWAVAAIWNATPEYEVAEKSDDVDADDSLWPFGSSTRGKL